MTLDISEHTLDNILQELVDYKDLLEHPEDISRVSEYITEIEDIMEVDREEDE